MKKQAKNSTFKKLRSQNLVPSLHVGEIREKVEAVTDFIFLGCQSMRTVTIAMNLKDACSLEEKLTNLDSILKNRDITLRQRSI